MGELDKQLIEATNNFKMLLQGMGERINPDNIDLMLQAFITGFNNGVEAMRDFSFIEGLDLKNTELLSDQAKKQATEI